MRSNKELLQVFLDNQDAFYSGLCAWENRLWAKGLITDDEYSYLQCEIITLTNRPKISHLKWLFQGANKRSYWWTKGYIKPRIEFLQKHLS